MNSLSLFFFKFLEDINPFCDTPVLDFWRVSSGVTPADLLTASMAADRFPTCVFQQR